VPNLVLQSQDIRSLIEEKMTVAEHGVSLPWFGLLLFSVCRDDTMSCQTM
jgi:hypothetical protein